MVVVVGAGVVGLAVARALAARGRAVHVLERLPRAGLETSARGSGVIHAGLYYPAGSLKARLCLEGRERLYDYCAERGVPHVRCGKLVVAQADEHAALDRVLKLAMAAGANAVPVDRTFVAAREPHVRADAAIWSPDTGWVHAGSLVQALQDDVVRMGGTLSTGADLLGVETSGGALVAVTESARMTADTLVNAAGLYADDVSAMAGGESFTIYPCRGEYAALAPGAQGLVHGLVYPVPRADGHGLGTHFTKTLDGSVWIGPTARYQDEKDDYHGERLPLESFLEPVRQMLPAVTMGDLRLAHTGIRPKLQAPHEHFADFMIRRDVRNPRLVQVAGIESPGLTACLAIGEMVAGVIDAR